jgi:hypothetical protein
MLQRFAIGVLAVVLTASTATAGPKMDKCVKWAKRASAVVCVAWATVHAPSDVDAHKVLTQQRKEQREATMKIDALAQRKRNMTSAPPPTKKPPARTVRTERPRNTYSSRPPRTLPRDTGYKARAERAKNVQASQKRRR